MFEIKKYYIRSSVLGGEVVSETDALGRKLKTIVRAAGATLAWQTVFYNASNNTETEYVNFEHWDASGMSYRSTLDNGTAITNEGGEGSPAELDPLGGNVGLFTPYIELTAPPFEPEYPTLQPMGSEDMMMVNGQRVPCMLDGFAIGCGQAQSMLDTGTAIPASLAHLQTRPGFQFNSAGLGLFTVFIPGGIDAPPPPGQPDDPDRGYATRDRWETFYFGVSWNITEKPIKLDKNQIEELRNQLKAALDPNQSPNGELCDNFLKETIKNLPGKIKAGASILDIFEKYAAKGGFYYAPGTVAGHNIRRALDKNPQIRLDFKNIKTRKYDLFGYPNSPDALVIELIHELLHGAGKGENDPDGRGRYMHEEMGQAMIRAGEKLKLSSKEKDVMRAGEDILKQACGGSPGWKSNDTPLDDLIK